MRTGRDIFLKRTRMGSSGFLPAMAPSVLAFGDKARGGAQHVAPGAEDRQRGIRRRKQVADALLCTVDAELGDEGGFAERGVGAGRFAQRGSVALHIEQVVGDLERLAERAAVIVQRLIFPWRGSAENCACDAAKAQQ